MKPTTTRERSRGPCWEVIEVVLVGLSACEVVVVFRSFLSSLILIIVQWWDGRMAGWHAGTHVVGGKGTGVGWREMLWYAFSAPVRGMTSMSAVVPYIPPDRRCRLLRATRDVALLPDCSRTFILFPKFVVPPQTLACYPEVRGWCYDVWGRCSDHRNIGPNFGKNSR